MEANLAVAPRQLEGARERVGILEIRLRWRFVPGYCGTKRSRRPEQAALHVLGAT